MAIAREPGQKSKVIVKSNQPEVDPVGSCIGVKGSRIKGIIDEIGGERVDIIPYSEDQIEQITFTWTNSTGNPNPQHDLQHMDFYDGWITIVENVGSPYVREMPAGYSDFRIKAHNSEGTIYSNEDRGESLPALEAPSSIIIFPTLIMFL